MTRDQKAAGIILCVVCVIAISGVLLGGKMSTARKAGFKEVSGQVVGGPQIVAGSPLIGYAVYIDELKGMVALNAEQCPPLSNGQRVVMHQRLAPRSAWYTFLRYAEK